MAGLAWAFSAQLMEPSVLIPGSATCHLLTSKKMAYPWTFTFLCGLLAANLVGATLTPPAVLSLSTEVIKQSKSWPPRLYHCKAGGRWSSPPREGGSSPSLGVYKAWLDPKSGVRLDGVSYKGWEGLCSQVFMIPISLS